MKPLDDDEGLSPRTPTLAEAKEVRDFDTYGTAEAARLLGVSDRRVRQMVSEGQLPSERDEAGVLSIPQQAVHDERARRRKEAKPEAPGRKPSSRPAGSSDAEVIAAAVAAAVSQVLAGQRELTAQAQSLVEVERRHAEQERERRLALEGEVVQLRAQLEAAAAQPAPARPRWWRRK